MMSDLLTPVTLLALAGSLFVSLGDGKGFIIWCFTNTFLSYYNYTIGEIQMCALFSAYLILSVVGVYNSYKKVTA